MASASLHVTISHRTEHSVEFVELDLVRCNSYRKYAEKALSCSAASTNQLEHRIGIDLEHPCRASDAQAFGRQAMTRTISSGRGALAMEDRAVGFSRNSRGKRRTAAAARAGHRDAHWRGYCRGPASRDRNNPALDRSARGCRRSVGGLECNG